jgi:SAM-dependent MidA family methyltransferase
MLDEAIIEHAARVRNYVMQQISAAGGWLSFETYMDLVLYAPGLGYYSSGAQKIGAGGDFTTAPEVSSLFGACVAVQCAEILDEVSAGCILEIGAGSGRLAVDILARLESLGKLPERYLILDVSADLRERQRQSIDQHLPHLLERVSWLDQPPDAAFDGVILANEVLDALPVVRFRQRDGGVEELGVVLEHGHFAWAARPASARIVQVCRELSQAGGGWDDGYESEYCARLAPWTRAVTQALRKGAVMWFDYGLPRSQYYFPQRRDGTLLCHFRHRAHDDVFLHPGLQDITAWVDFTSLAEASHEAGFELAGFTTQAFFLAASGIAREMQRIGGHDETTLARLGNQARQLVLPGEMGERFKSMAWSKALDIPLSAFALQDLRHTL